MRKLIVDIESDSLDVQTTNIFCVCFIDVETKEEFSITPEPNEFYVKPEQIKDFIKEDDVLIAHNGFGFDYFVLYFKDIITIDQMRRYYDTLIIAKLATSKVQLEQRDFYRRGFPKRLVGSYSLKAFGYRLGEYKEEFSQFTHYSQEMLDYCMQDCRVTLKLLITLYKRPYLPRDDVIKLENDIAMITKFQELTGFMFDIAAANLIKINLTKEKKLIEQKLQKIFPMRTKRGTEVPTPRLAHYKSRGYRVVGPYCTISYETFNPGSRKQIVERLSKIWTPTVFTAKGNPVVNEDTLPKNEITEDLVRYLKIVKDLGQMSEGQNSLMNLYNPVTKRIHGRADTLGANTHRFTHSNPNFTQVNKTKEFRDCFITTEDKVLIGVDADALTYTRACKTH